MLDAPHVVENAHYDTVTDLVLAPEIKSLITCGNDFKVKTWDAFRLAATRTFNIPQSSLMRVTYLDQAKAVVVCSFMNDVLLLSVEDGSLVNSLVGHKDCVDVLVWTTSCIFGAQRAARCSAQSTPSSARSSALPSSRQRTAMSLSLLRTRSAT
eukprot:TRINITY_DN1713_c0_g1_i6.p1 TRINITY_DN1713_c0_g1~~TRINITY_DN1713_c0_g1_i6.p1  ORF type:complete len:154 (-),score=18.25 TRINITY_DN1713_c0_g1_i6:244-705(-)